MTTTQPAGYVNRSNTVRTDLDTFTPVPAVQVQGRRIKAGMILLDPVLLTPAAEVDARVSARNGTVTFNVHHLDRVSFSSVTLTEGGTVAVMAR